jgi:hypothetical protein
VLAPVLFLRNLKNPVSLFVTGALEVELALEFAGKGAVDGEEYETEADDLAQPTSARLPDPSLFSASSSISMFESARVKFDCVTVKVVSSSALAFKVLCSRAT